MMQGHRHFNSAKVLPLGVIALATTLAWSFPANAGNAGPVEQAVVYAQCMRQNGFADFPDPDSEGRILLRPRLDSRSAPAFRAAHLACNDVAPPGWRSERPDPNRRAKLLGFTKCVRAKGVADFPDPAARGEFDFGRIADSPTLRTAMENCRRATGVMVGFGG